MMQVVTVIVIVGMLYYVLIFKKHAVIWKFTLALSFLCKFRRDVTRGTIKISALWHIKSSVIKYS